MDEIAIEQVTPQMIQPHETVLLLSWPELMAIRAMGDRHGPSWDWANALKRILRVSDVPEHARCVVDGFDPPGQRFMTPAEYAVYWEAS